MSAIHNFRLIYPEAQLRYVVGPKETLQSGGFPLKFIHRQIMQMIEQGRNDAFEVVRHGEGTVGHAMLQQWQDMQRYDSDNQIKPLKDYIKARTFVA